MHSTNQDTGNRSADIGTRLVLHNGVLVSVDCSSNYSSNINVGNGRCHWIMFGLEVPLQ